MTNTLTRTFAGDLEIRSDGRTIVGLCVPFDVPARVSDDGRHAYDEVWQRGAFARTIAERGDRVKLLVQHNRQALPIGRATSLTENSAGLFGEFHVSDTAAGNEALELIRDGALDGLSIGFRPIRQDKQGNTVTRTEARLDEVSVVSFPAFDSARIAALRSAEQPHILLARRRFELAKQRIESYR